MFSFLFKKQKPTKTNNTDDFYKVCMMENKQTIYDIYLMKKGI